MPPEAKQQGTAKDQNLVNDNTKESAINIDINRDLYDHADDHKAKFVAEPGINEEVVRLISKTKQEPEWMLQKRLKALKLFQNTKTPTWGPNIKKLDLNKITYFVDPNAKESTKWEDVPEEIKNTFEKLGIPEAERKALAGAGAQWDSGMVYHNLKKSLKDKGVIFENMDTAIKKYPKLIKEHFMTKCIPINDHKFIMLHAAVWSGGTFIYVPKNTKVDLPLQAYFRMNQESGGQFEHTLIIVDEGAELHYIEGCFTEGNKIITKEGHKKIEEIKKGELVLTDDGTFQKVTKKYSMPFTGNIAEITIQGDPINKITVTDDHPFLYIDKKRANERNSTWKPRWNLPRFFKKGDYLAIPINKTVISNKTHVCKIKKWDNKQKTFKKVNKKIPSTKEFFRLAGYYLAEGSISGGFYLNFSFNIGEKEYITDVKRLLKKVFKIEKVLEFPYKKNNGINLVVSSVELCRIFQQFGKGANKKHIPEWMMLEDPEKQKELIKGYFRGDGNYYNKRSKKTNALKEMFRINSVSEELIVQCKDLLLRLGVVAFINKRDRTKENRQTMYTLGITGDHMLKFSKIVSVKISEKVNGKNRGSRLGIDQNFAYFPIKNIEKYQVKERLVFNLAVEKRETYCVNGVVAHNCSSPRYQESSLHAGCVEIFVKKNAKMRYTSIENWSRNVFNLNTKRALVYKDANMIWVNGNMGCLTGDSQIFTSKNGPIPIKDIEVGEEVLTWNKDKNSIENKIITAKMSSGKKKVFSIKAGGRELKASANHPFLTLERIKNNSKHKKGFFHASWKALEELKEGDVIGIIKKADLKEKKLKIPEYNYNKKIKTKNQYTSFLMNSKSLFNQEIILPKYSNNDFMWFLGILLGDGFVDNKSNKINIALHKTDDLRSTFIKVVKKLFNYEIKNREERYIEIYSKAICDTIKKIGFTGTAKTKKIPKWVFTLPKDQINNFLAGYFDADGHPSKNALAFTSINKKILEDIKILGIQCSYHVSQVFRHSYAGKKIVVGNICNTSDSWRIHLNGKIINKFPSRSKKKAEKITKIKSKRNYNSSKGWNFKSKCNKEIGFARIDSIVPQSIQETYDIEVEDNHNFISEGLIVHNSHATMLYPCSILLEEGAHTENLGVAFAGKNQDQDTGSKVIHAASNTTSIIRAKSLSKDGGISTYRGLVKVMPKAKNTKSNVECDALLLDDKSVSKTYPYMKINNPTATISHEATVSKINDEQLFYLQSRGLNTEQATKLLVSGFISDVTKALPLEYAIELNKLIELEVEGM